MYQKPLWSEPESDVLPSSRRVSRANPSQVVASVSELMTSVISGPKSQEYLATRAPDGSWVKMSGGYSLFPAGECSEPFLETWPTWGSALDGVAMGLTKPLEQPIDATGCLSSDTWPTARANSAMSATCNPEANFPNLETVVAKWATPQAFDSKDVTRMTPTCIAGGRTLANDIAMWRTPSAGDPDGGIMEIREGADGKYKLRDDAPDFAKRFHQDQTTSTGGENSCEIGPTSPLRSHQGKRLNYRFVQRLMGFPDDWL